MYRTLGREVLLDRVACRIGPGKKAVAAAGTTLGGKESTNCDNVRNK